MSCHGSGPGPGLANLGNTCYLNAAIQCLRNTPLFKSDWFDEDHIHPERKGAKLTEELANLINELNTCKKSVNPRLFVRHFIDRAREFNPDIRIGAPADADEAVHIIIDSLHVQLSRHVQMEITGAESQTHLSHDQAEFVKSLQSWMTFFKLEYSPFVNAFFGQTQIRLSCRYCSASSTRYEPWDLLKLEIPGADIVGGPAPSLEDCFTSAFAPETPDDYTCDMCKEKGTTIKEQSISKFPNTLIISLKRFTNSGAKIRARIAYDAECVDLMMWRSWTQLQMSDECEYRVVGTIEHLGTSRGGHYFARCRADDNSWNVFDDDSVSPCSIGGTATPDTYVLFLERCSD
jgi:ubiquitin C-terminal hydrolase